jgi:uncharacterized protein
VFWNSPNALDDKALPATDAITEVAKVEFLSRPDSYSDHPIRVDVIETHLSWVFLTDRLAYKFKKPLRRTFLDFGTLDARRRNCDAELRLNRRLAPDVYQAVIPLVRLATGALRIGGIGEPVEWLVKMRRLARDQMLDVAIQHRTVEPVLLRRVAQLLAEFYRRAVPADMQPVAYRERLAKDIQDNAVALADSAYRLDATQLKFVVGSLERYLSLATNVFETRVLAGRIIEGHGDLRPDHIFLAPEPLIIDCLEFSRDLRLLDPADELAYLSLECEHANAAWIGELIFAVYRDVAGDNPPPQLVAFYHATRALLRAKLSAWHLADRDLSEHPHWLAKAASYLQLAATHAGRC